MATRFVRYRPRPSVARDACIAYSQRTSTLPLPLPLPLPAGVRAPAHTLEQYKALRFPFAPGHG